MLVSLKLGLGHDDCSCKVHVRLELNCQTTQAGIRSVTPALHTVTVRHLHVSLNMLHTDSLIQDSALLGEYHHPCRREARTGV